MIVVLSCGLYFDVFVFYDALWLNWLNRLIEQPALATSSYAQ